MVYFTYHIPDTGRLALLLVKNFSLPRVTMALTSVSTDDFDVTFEAMHFPYSSNFLSSPTLRLPEEYPG
jgi:hypothetical protein